MCIMDAQCSRKPQRRNRIVNAFCTNSKLTHNSVASKALTPKHLPYSDNAPETFEVQLKALEDSSEEIYLSRRTFE